jgi:hypothetical protein
MANTSSREIPRAHQWFDLRGVHRAEHNDAVVGQISLVVERPWVAEISRRPQLHLKSQSFPITEAPHRRTPADFFIFRIGLFRVDPQPQSRANRLSRSLRLDLFGLDIDRLPRSSVTPVSNLSFERDVCRHNRVVHVSERQDLSARKLLRIAKLNFESAYEKTVSSTPGEMRAMCDASRKILPPRETPLPPRPTTTQVAMHIRRQRCPPQTPTPPRTTGRPGGLIAGENNVANVSGNTSLFVIANRERAGLLASERAGSVSGWPTAESRIDSYQGAASAAPFRSRHHRPFRGRESYRTNSITLSM